MMQIPITQKGYDKLLQDIHDIKQQFNEVIEELGKAKEHGDLSENAEYHAALEKQNTLNRRMQELEIDLANAVIINPQQYADNDLIRFGATVKVIDLEDDQTLTYSLAGKYEADLHKQIISVTSPIGKALLQKRKGDIVEVIIPRGTRTLEILEISYEDF